MHIQLRSFFTRFLFVCFVFKCLRKAKCVSGCGQKRAVPAPNCSSTALFSGVVSLCIGTSKILLHHRSTEENQVTLTHFLGSGGVWLQMSMGLIREHPEILNLIVTTDGLCLICRANSALAAPEGVYLQQGV